MLLYSKIMNILLRMMLAFSLSMAFRLSVHTNSGMDQLGFNSWQKQQILLFSDMMI